MMSANKVPVLCRFGGNFIWESNKVYYKGGTNRIAKVNRTIDCLTLFSEVCGICKFIDISSIKYKYPTLDLDSLVSIENDDDVSNMMEAFSQSSKPIQLFLFGAQNLSIPIAIPSNLMQNANAGNVQASLRGLHGINETRAPSSHNTNANKNGFPSASNDLRETKCLLMDNRVNDMPKTMLILEEGQEFEYANPFDKVLGEHAICSNFPYKRTSIGEPFEAVIYPKGDPDAVSISKRDLELLQPETFINDTIIDFYIKYLNNKIRLEDKRRFHFFNSFFFRKLADLNMDSGSAEEGRAAFLRVCKWTRKVNLFEKDFIFIPVIFNDHWSLMVICHPGEVASFKDEEIEKAPKVPCILHMDSIKGMHMDFIKGSHIGLKNLIQSYLWEEWKQRRGESSKDVSLKFSNLQFVPLELPQQENSFDCGLFLLHYVERFLEEAPVNFNPFKITKFSSFLNVDWFPPCKASHKRSVIQKLILELLNDHSLKIPPATCNTQHGSPIFQETSVQKEQAVEFLSEQCSLTKKRGLCNSFFSAVQCDKESGIIFRKFLDQGNIARSSLDVQCEPFYQVNSFQELSIPKSPLECLLHQEDAETGEQYVFSPSDRIDHKLQAEIMVEACPAPYSSNDIAAPRCHVPKRLRCNPSSIRLGMPHPGH